MKIRNLVVVLLVLSSSCFAQNNFDLGVNFLNSGDYRRADSCLTLYVKSYPGDKNGLYNLSVVKLFLGDTCSFCNGLLNINYPYEVDKEALKLYFEFCGYADTIYYNKKNEVASKSDFKYYEVIEHSNCQNLVIGKYHQKKSKIEVVQSNIHQINSFKTDIFAVYQVYNDSNKIFTFGTSVPVFASGKSSLQKVLKKSPAYEKARSVLNLSGYQVNFNVVIDKNGKPGSIEIVSSKPEIDNKEKLLKYFDQMFKDVPLFTPAKYNGEFVNFKISEWLSF